MIIINSFRFAIPSGPFDTGWRSSFGGSSAILFSSNLSNVATPPIAEALFQVGGPPLAFTPYSVSANQLPGGAPNGDTGWLSSFSGPNSISFASNLTNVATPPVLIATATQPLATVAYTVGVDALPGGAPNGDTGYLSVFASFNTIDFSTNLTNVPSAPVLTVAPSSPLASTPYAVGAIPGP